MVRALTKAFRFLTFSIAILGGHVDVYANKADYNILAGTYNSDISDILAVIFFIVIISLLTINYILRIKVKKTNVLLKKQNDSLSLALHAGKLQVWNFDVEKKMFYNIEGNIFPENGLPYEDKMKWFSKEDSIKFGTIMDKLISGETVSNISYFKMRKPDEKQWKYIEKDLTAIKDEQGIVSSIIGTSRDVTETIETQKKMQENIMKTTYAIKSSKMVLWELNSSDVMCKIYNDPIYGYNEEVELSLEEYARYVHPDDRGTFLEALKRLKTGENKIVTIEGKLMYPDEKWHYCTMSCAPLEINNETNQVIRYVGYRRDNTDTLEMQNKLKNEMEKAKESDRLKSAFLANMSHEIRTPLNAIVGFSNLLQSTDNPKDKEEFVKIINTSNEMLLRLINDILDLSKIESETMVIAREKVNLTSLFISTCQSLSHVIQNDNVKFIIDNPYDNCTATVDYNRIAQIITNFVTNAAKHTKKGYIKVGYKYIDGGLRFYVQDTGAGIPKDKQNEIFERFVKLNNFVQGTGLGLSICKAIVNRCGGNIGCDSEVGKGSIFWFWTPCKVELIKERQKTTETQTIADVPETTVKENTGKSILVAEDDDSNFILVKYLLKEYFVDRAKNGKEAIEKAQRHKYDAILMDMRMPIIGGMEAANEIRTFDKSVPIIAVTANAFDSDRAKAIEAGCDDYLSKPLDEATLKELLLKYIKK